MAGWTNRGKRRMMEVYLAGGTPPTNFYLALCTSATAPTADTNTLSELTQVAAGNGYTSGGISFTRNGTDFVITEDDGNDRAQAILQKSSADPQWTASGGNLPASGSGARYAVLTDDNATMGSREIIAYWDLTSDRVVSDGQYLRLDDPTLRGNES